MNCTDNRDIPLNFRVKLADTAIELANLTVAFHIASGEHVKQGTEETHSAMRDAQGALFNATRAHHSAIKAIAGYIETTL